MPKKGGRRRKHRTHSTITEDDSLYGDAPKSFIIKRGKVSRFVGDLLKNMREVMYPYTASKLKESEKIKIRDYIKAGNQLGITHLMVFSSTEKANYLKIIKTPDGPTFTFKIINYTTQQDIIDSRQTNKSFAKTFMQPILILNGFNTFNPNFVQNLTKQIVPQKSNYRLVSLMLQSLFPPLNIEKLNINKLKKVAMFNLNQENDQIYFRYFQIETSYANINMSMKKILQTKNIPNLRDYNDISDYVFRNKNNQLEEEFDIEDELENESGEKNNNQEKSQKQIKQSISLYEVGPRMALKLYKIQEGLMNGNVVYHRLFEKDTDEVLEQSQKVKEKMKQKELRKQEQQERIIAKMKQKQTFKEKDQEQDEGEEEEDEQENIQSQKRSKNHRRLQEGGGLQEEDDYDDYDYFEKFNKKIEQQNDEEGDNDEELDDELDVEEDVEDEDDQ